METIKSLCKERLIVACQMNGAQVNMLIDTGATVGLVSKRIKGLKKGRKYNGSLIGAGGDLGTLRVCDIPATLGGKMITQFLIADIDGIVDSIKKQTGVEIGGIISLPQMKFYGVEIDTDDNFIRI